ncbi:uncharacterized protein LOC132169677 [Corylus avellana]|uniref:uncharacterized protein LOC132169677 n=1 Tax=Corylus avellana TaxID=13451 RepID=UPI00286C4577|nr:uncharacterized protein LOC132169677 [Corylus avellana]
MCIFLRSVVSIVKQRERKAIIEREIERERACESRDSGERAFAGRVVSLRKRRWWSPVGVVLLRKRRLFDSGSNSLNRSGGWAPTTAVWVPPDEYFRDDDSSLQYFLTFTTRLREDKRSKKSKKRCRVP